MTRLASLFLVVLGTSAACPAENIVETAREIPVAYDVDVLVAGGSLGAVSAALEAARSGASVFLAAPRTYLGDDVCATYRLWLEPGEEPLTPLAKDLFVSTAPPAITGSRLPFTYEGDQAAAAPHPDPNSTFLSDGKYGNAASQSVQYNGNVNLILDLGTEHPIGGLHLLAFQRKDDFDLQQITVWTSADKQHWEQAAVAVNAHAGQGMDENHPVHLYAALTGAARYLKVLAEKTPAAKRLLLGEIVVAPASQDGVQASPELRWPPTPMQVKRVLESALIKEGVAFLYGCYPTDVLRDASGNVAGMLMANRSGRQAVRAKVLIDATTRATLSRLAGAAFSTYPAGDQTFQRVVVCSQPREDGGLRVKRLPTPLPFGQENESGNAFEYTLTLPMNDGSFASFAEAEQRARDLTWTPTQAVTSDRLFQTPPDAVRSKKQVSGAWPGAENLDLDAFRPVDVERLYVLGGCADLARETAAALLRPLNLLDVGTRVGREAAAEAKRLPNSTGLRLPATATGAASRGEAREVLNGLRPTDTALPTVPCEAQNVPVLGAYDVVVVGGGTGGAPAGIAAARQGAKTLVLESQDGLGGVGTLGLIGKYYYGFRKGFTEEIDRGVAAMGEDPPENSYSWKVEWKMEWYRRELRKAGAEIWFGALGCGALVEQGRVTGVLVATPEGRGIVLAKTVIDATGNADIAFAAGAECVTTGAAHMAVQGSGMPPYQPGEYYTNTDYTITDDADTVDTWRTFVAGRAKYKNAFDLAQIVDSRERRRIAGDFIISPLDIWNHRSYPDSIGLAKSNFDTHGFTVHALFALRAPSKDEIAAYVPYRALLPRGLDGILVTGLGISAHRDAMPILRMQPDIQNQGYAAGLAAAMAAKSGTPLRNIDIKTLQEELVKMGNLPKSALNDADSYPFSAEQLENAVGTLAENGDNISIILTQPQTALPLLRDAYRKAEVEDAKLVYARALGMLGDPAGAETLLRAAANGAWDSGWAFTGSGQYGGSLSPYDSLLIALARTRDPRALTVIMDKAKLLGAEMAFSHHRATAIALETLARPEAAPCLAALLAKPGMSGYACTDIAKAKENAELPDANLDRDRSIRELLLARALFRCGDLDGIALRILNDYKNDLRGHWARHAQAILSNTAGAAAPGSELDIECVPAARGK